MLEANRFRVVALLRMDDGLGCKLVIYTYIGALVIGMTLAKWFWKVEKLVPIRPCADASGCIVGGGRYFIICSAGLKIITNN